MTKQVIYSRYQYSCGKQTAEELFQEIHDMVEPAYDERGVQVGGISAAYAVDTKEAILLVMSLEAETLLKLKYSNRPDVKINRYY